MKYIILIPAYEPDSKLLNLIKEISNKYPVIVVNDGSNKSYQDVFSEVKKYAHLLSYGKNMGKGYALKTGLNYIEDTYDNYIVVTMDADGQHTLKDAMKLCDYVKEHKDTLVLGKRSFNKNVPLRSRIGNMITRKVFKIITKNEIYDTQTGLRAFSKELIDYMINNPGNRYEYEMNVLLNLKKQNIKYHEIPIETIYLNHNKSSHFNSFKDTYKIYKEIFKWHKNNKN